MDQAQQRSRVVGAIGSAAMTALHLQSYAHDGNSPPYFNHATIKDTAEVGRTFFGFLGSVIHFIRQTVRYTLIGAFLLTTSTAMYALAYVAIMPENHATEPIFFDYNYKGCGIEPCPPTAVIDLASMHTQWQAHVSDVVYHLNDEHDTNNINTCTDSCANVTVAKDEQLQNTPRIMIPNHSYFIQIALNLPESEFNRQLGMFMVEVRLQSKIKNDSLTEINGNRNMNAKHENEEIKLLAKSSRPTMLPYQSAYVSFVKNSFIMLPLILGAVPECRTVVIECFDHYKESMNYPMTLVEVRLVVPTHFTGSGDTGTLFQNVQVWNAELRIGKELNRIQWFMQAWFYTAAFVGIVFFMLLQIVCSFGFNLWTKLFYTSMKNAVGEEGRQGDHDRARVYEFHEDDFSDFASNLNVEGSASSPRAKIYSNVRPDFFEDDCSDHWIPTRTDDHDHTPDQSIDNETSGSNGETDSASRLDKQDTSENLGEEEPKKGGGTKNSKRKRRKKKKKRLSSDKSELRRTSNSNQMPTEAERHAADKIMRGDFQPYEIFTGEYIYVIKMIFGLNAVSRNE